MKTLIVEDDFVSRVLLQEILKGYGSCHVAVHGGESVEAVRLSLAEKEPYDLICLDIMMPVMDGRDALERMRALEREAGAHEAKIVMTTALNDMKTLIAVYDRMCDAFLTQPIHKERLLNELRNLGLIR